MKLLVAPLAVTAQFTDGLANRPQMGVVGMRLEAPFVGETQHLVVHACRIAYSQHVDAAVNQFLTDPVNRHITLGTHHDLVLPHQCLPNRLHEGRRLSRSGRSVHNGYIL